ncbi:GNAT family N-acetyltransferase [Xylanimonas protaetiae]|uniref:N-acetyltransferase n=1 Tax=Xylanimonas protaetiae TaxID=2509457 RepID=A0A4P6FI32_9MICO|nr:N-acetyltransferase [Xylanimonas protaetiae]QAY70218.1 N-acetyltransferase [Xylanimonas protaetiae]
MQLRFRVETPADHRAVEALTRDAFWRFWEPGQAICHEHLLVHRLRTADEFVPELSLVAEAADRVVGHIAFTTAAVVQPDGVRHQVLTFGPLTVAPDSQGLGVGRALMDAAFAKARTLGFRGVVIFGHPAYYPRAGFEPAARYGITAPGGHSFDAIMALPLVAGGLDGVSGEVHVPAVYESLDDAAALEFDRQFPPREPHVPTSVAALTDRLAPGAAAAITASGIQSVEMLTSRSEREVAALDGVDAAALETVRAVAREHGVAWGDVPSPRPRS